MSGPAEVVTLYAHNARSVPDMLRSLAVRIEAGEYGDEVEVALALWGGSELETFSWGRLADVGAAHMLFSAAAHALIRPILDHKG